MTESLSSSRIEVTATTTDEADRLLDRAARTLQHRALRGDRRGILATRHGAGLYTLELNEAVPYGLTLEQSA
jgi:hypothetical protein